MAKYSISTALVNLRPGGSALRRSIVDRLNVELAKAARAPDVAQKFDEQIDMEIVASSPEEFAALQASEHERWFKVIKDNDTKGD